MVCHVEFLFQADPNEKGQRPEPWLIDSVSPGRTSKAFNNFIKREEDNRIAHKILHVVHALGGRAVVEQLDGHVTDDDQAVIEREILGILDIEDSQEWRTPVLNGASVPGEIIVRFSKD